MSVPPQPPGFGPPPYPQQPNWGPQQPNWRPPYGQYPAPPPGPPKRNRNGLLLALAFLAVIAVAVAATVWFTHRGPNTKGGNADGGAVAVNAPAAGDVASAMDTGPVGVITEDPTCERFVEIENRVGSQLANWNDRDASVPASAWTPQQRQMFESAARIINLEADQLVPLARETPHRVMRELYTQVIAYDRAYAGAVANYTPAVDRLVIVSNGLSAGALGVCLAIRDLTAANRGPSTPPAAAPSAVAPVGDPDHPEKFMTTPFGGCEKLASVLAGFQMELQAWIKTDPNIPASQLSSADRVLFDMAAKVMSRVADDLDDIGRASGNPIVEDFLVLSAQYYRAYVSSVPTYTSADHHLYDVARQTSSAVKNACSAA